VNEEERAAEEARNPGIQSKDAHPSAVEADQGNWAKVGTMARPAWRKVTWIRLIGALLLAVGLIAGALMVSRFRRSCVVDGIRYYPGPMPSLDRCNSWWCEDGKVAHTAALCLPPAQWQSGQPRDAGSRASTASPNRGSPAATAVDASVR
jgi:hypothetical protein